VRASRSDVPLPRDPIGYVAAFLRGMGALYAIGLVVAAVAPVADGDASPSRCSSS
jgi:hypothetical protein